MEEDEEDKEADELEEDEADKLAEEDEQDDEDEDNEDNEEGGDSKNKGGRLSKSAIAQAHAIRQKYQDDLQALADKEGKSFAAILSAVGDSVPDTRSINP